jgi:thiol reductant ABC exporter CydD subunit
MSVERRLSTQTPAVRGFVALSVGLGTLTAVAVLLQAWLLAGVVSTSFTERVGPVELVVSLSLLLGVVLVRAGLAWAVELAAHRASARTKSEQRRALLGHAMRLGPHWLAGRRTAQLETLATRGLDDLDAYFARYLPSLVLAFVVPTAVVAVVAVQDPLSAVIMGVTLPLIPLFMALVGVGTKRLTARRLSALQRLAGHFLDSVDGLGTLKVFGRSAERVREVGLVTDVLRRETMGTLRVAFLSSLVLELVASLSVAVVAVSVGLRLVAGDLALATGLFVLVLAPEAYLPLRRLGAQFHSSADGVAAATKVFEVLDTPPAGAGSAGIRALPGPDAPEITLDDVTVHSPGRGAPALERVSLRVAAGSVVALTGPSGCGKSTLLQVLLGTTPVDTGRVWVDGVEVAALDIASWRRQVAWVPQRPHLFGTSLRGNITLGRPDATVDEIDRAVRDAGLAVLVDRLPRGLETPLGERGFGLSAGERQRVALARAFVVDAAVLLLDEPTANLDGDTEAAVLDALRRRATGRTVVMAAHRPSLVSLADRVVSLDRLCAQPAEVLP